MSFDLEWQKVLYAQLDGALACSVEVTPPHGIALPYVQIGETTIEDHPIGNTLFFDVHTWSAAEGSHEAKELQHIIRQTLHARSFTGGGYAFSCCRESDARVFRDVDDEHWHGVQTFRLIAS